MPITATTNYRARKLEPAYQPEKAVTQAAKIASGNYAAGTVLGLVGATGALKAYANGNSDGSETAVAIAMYDMYSDGTNVSITAAGALIAGETATDAPVYIAGFFRCDQLTGLDANGVTDMKARLVDAPNLASGVLALF